MTQQSCSSRFHDQVPARPPPQCSSASQRSRRANPRHPSPTRTNERDWACVIPSGSMLSAATIVHLHFAIAVSALLTPTCSTLSLGCSGDACRPLCLFAMHPCFIPFHPTHVSIPPPYVHAKPVLTSTVSSRAN